MGLLSSLEPCLDTPLNRDQKVLLYGAIMNYLFQGGTQATIRKLLTVRKDIEFDFKSWRMNLILQGELLLNCKLWLYAQVRSGGSEDDYNLSYQERRALLLSLEYQPLKDRLLLLSKRTDARNLSLGMYQKIVQNALFCDDTRAYTRSFLSSKMRFLVNSYGVDYDDLESDLHRHAVFAIYKSYPRFENLGHVIAIAKTAIHNRGINIIKERTTQKYNQLLQNSDGSYNARMVSLDTLYGNFLLEENDGTNPDWVTDITGSSSDSEMQRNLRHLSQSPGISPRQRRLVRILLGEYDEEFSAYLKADNHHAVESMRYPSYMTKACSFLGIRVDDCRAFFLALTPDL